MARRRRRSGSDLSGLIIIGSFIIIGWWTNNVGSLRSLLGVLLGGIAVALAGVWWLRRRARLRLERSGINEIDVMSGEQFEKFLSAHFTRTGGRVKLTPKQADYGGDLVVEQGGARIIVQAKRWNRSVGVDAVQEAVAAIGYYRADGARVVTNNRFTHNARKLAAANGVELWDRDDLIRRLLDAADAAPNRSEPRAEPADTDAAPACPLCGQQLAVKKGRYGAFWGCGGYPECGYTHKITK